MQSQSTTEYNSQDHIYPTKVSANSFKICDLNSKLICFAIGFINSFMTEVPYFQRKSMDWFLYDRDLRHERVAGPTIWNRFLTEGETAHTNIVLFRIKILNFSNEFLFF